MNDPARALHARLQARERAGRYRRRRLREGPPGPWMTVDGRRLLAFASNDYLGLAGDPRLRAAFAQAAERYGVGAGAAHLLGGHTPVHHRLEEALAEHLGQPRALLFSTGYMANLGVIAALVRRGERVLQDRLNHASLLDGARLAGARLQRYRHGDAEDLAARLEAGGAALVATDGVFSMDGDLAPLTRIAPLARRHRAWLLVDDAHGLGVVGPAGQGSPAHLGLAPEEVDLHLVTLGKALGAFGAAVAGSEALIETLIQDARSYVYTTAPPPAVAASALAALEIARTEDWRRDKLRALIRRLRQGAEELGLALLPSDTPIQPLLVGDDAAAVALSRHLEAAGIWVPAIRPPTVPEGQARLRITLSAAHEEADVDRLLAALEHARGRACD